ncbi:hypothetical protein Gxy13693_046_028 [Komagataeibacter xylinus NBRC 13693]|uniref:Uncharacterized protein n=1 Tax=Komagataeibacter xylinus NBRC 13693 TaxID=1234668 RepID=A0A0D6QC66_KOMXY|nr:hypothetical protein [Komagataeibacter xylinus]GAO00402.1 hypothetical protein Gxy13693_046_028 [Komagataeibacter xylinus NBRC 13693]
MAVITASEGRITLKADFHPELAIQARRYRGRFLGKEIGWSFLPEHAPAIRQLCQTLYGVDGTPSAWNDCCTVQVEVDEQDVRAPLWRQFNADIYLGGRHVVGVFGPRQAVRTGRGIKFLRGQPHCATRIGAYHMEVPTGSVLEIRKYPRAALAFLGRCLDGHGSWRMAQS